MGMKCAADEVRRHLRHKAHKLRVDIHTPAAQGWKFMSCSHCQRVVSTSQLSPDGLHESEQPIRSQVSKQTQLLTMTLTNKFPLQKCLHNSPAFFHKAVTIFRLIFVNILWRYLEKSCINLGDSFPKKLCKCIFSCSLKKDLKP